MTDKDIKDYCKNCDVEPPAMRFKCPECEHNPDNENNFAKDINVPRKEPIMIDGVDVSRCKYLPYCNDKQGNCAFEPNCYFKQHARKTAECELLETQLESYYIGEAKLVQRNQELEQECEELLKENQQLRNSLSDSLMFKFTGQENETNRYRKALDEIEEVWKRDNTGDYDFIKFKILDIISRAKGEE